jgi:transposase
VWKRRAQERVARARLDALHKAALRIVRGADVVALEDLHVASMTCSAKGTVEQPAAILRQRMASIERCSMRTLGFWLG